MFQCDSTNRICTAVVRRSKMTDFVNTPVKLPGWSRGGNPTKLAYSVIKARICKITDWIEEVKEQSQPCN